MLVHAALCRKHARLGVILGALSSVCFILWDVRDIHSVVLARGRATIPVFRDSHSCSWLPAMLKPRSAAGPAHCNAELQCLLLNCGCVYGLRLWLCGPSGRAWPS